MIKKIVIYGVMAFAAYWGLSFYTTYSIAEKVSNCGGRFGLLQGVEKSELTREKFLASPKAWRCVKQDQNFLESLFFKIPDIWINPPRPYVDPPFAAEELADDFVADKNISEDLKALAKFYEGESDRFTRIMNLLIASDKTQLRTQQISQRYGEVSEELKSIAARLSELHPNTSPVDELHQKFIYTLKRIAADGQELKLLFISVSRDLEEGETILALPKSAIAENKSRLLDIRDRLMRAEMEIENKLEALKQNQRNAMEALDGLETLASKHGASLSK